MADESRLSTIGVQKIGSRLKICHRINELIEESKKSTMALIYPNSTPQHNLSTMTKDVPAAIMKVHLTPAGKVSQAGQAFLKAHHPWIHIQYMHGKNVILISLLNKH